MQALCFLLSQRWTNNQRPLQTIADFCFNVEMSIRSIFASSMVLYSHFGVEINKPEKQQTNTNTPSLHNKIPAKKIFARGWVAQEPIFS